MSTGISDKSVDKVLAVYRREAKAAGGSKLTIPLRVIADELGFHLTSVHRARNVLIGRGDIRRIGVSSPMRIEVLR